MDKFSLDNMIFFNNKSFGELVSCGLASQDRTCLKHYSPKKKVFAPAVEFKLVLK